MKPNENGWLQDYLDFRRELHKDLTTDEGRKSSHPEHSLYRIIQPTGLMYGQSVGELDLLHLEKLSEKQRKKILLAESLISSSLLFYDKPVRNPFEVSNVISQTLENIGNFYNNIFPEVATPVKTLFGRKKSPVELAEKILDKRIELTSELEGNFWSSYFHNSLLFLDVFIFGQWIHTNTDRIVADFFRYERDELRFSVVKVIAAAAHANKEIAIEEKALFEYFLQSTDLPAEKRKESLMIFEKGIAIEDINLPAENSWILKKYFLEMAILTIWADKKVEKSEQDFLNRFCAYLGFNEEDLENSMIAMEGFVLEHWEQLQFLQTHDYQNVSEQFIARVSKIIDKNQSRLIKQLFQSEDKVELLKKARAHELTNEEQNRIRYDIIQVLKTLPTFGAISLPQRFLTLPVLLKMLPKRIFMVEA